MILKSIARNYVFPFFIKSGIAEVISRLSNNTHIVLNYHGVVRNLKLDISVNHLHIDNFEKQIQHFKKNYNILSQEEFINSINKGSSSKRKNILITFDDGYENNYINAYPILKHYDAPATIFPVVNLINSNNPTWYDFLDLNKKLISKKENHEILEKMFVDSGYPNLNPINFSVFKNQIKLLSNKDKVVVSHIIKNALSIPDIIEKSNLEYWKILNQIQIAEMTQGDFITFGSHTLNHPNLDQISVSELTEELSKSQTKLSEITNKKINSIAFPDGAYNDNVKKVCYEIGYQTLFSVNSRCKSDQEDKNIFQRFSISNTTTAESTIFNVALSLNKIGY